MGKNLSTEFDKEYKLNRPDIMEDYSRKIDCYALIATNAIVANMERS